MSKTLAVSHIFIISKDMDIVDLGEYAEHLLHVSSGLEPPIWNPPGIVGRLPFSRTLIIEHPSTKSKQIFISSDEKVPITDIFSCSNRNGDCLIYGTIKGNQPIIGETSIIVIKPYPLLTDVMQMVKEVEVHNKFISRGARYIKMEKGTNRSKATEMVLRPNPIIERMKQVQL